MGTKQKTLIEKVKENYKYFVAFVIVCLVAYLISDLPFVRVIDANIVEGMKPLTNLTIESLKDNYSTTKDFVRVMFN